MCKAFSCLIHRNRTVTWKFGVDSHEDLINIAGYKDDKDDPAFAWVEISPENNDYLNPEAKYVFRLDEERTPSWWSPSYENKCWDAQEKWLAQLNKILIRKAIIHPFRIMPPKEITDDHIKILKEWASVRDSVGASVWAYTGSFFMFDRTAWKYTENIKTDEYPFLPLVKLWEQGLVPSFDGKMWRLHGGKEAKVLWEAVL